jgi:hydrogenase nickel incorporation protein HypB
MCAICGCDDDHQHTHHDHHEHHEHLLSAEVTPVDSHHAIPAQLDHNPERLVRIEREILGKNDAFADANRARLTDLGVLALNLMSSPGAGKTSLLVATIERLRRTAPIAVIEGDQATANDAERIRAAGAPAVQINTGRGCHLDAHMVGHALDDLPLEIGSLLFIENVGNLICPTAFDLGETHKIALLSVTEGDDKPLKYPDMFAVATLLVLSKTDLLPYVRFDPDRAIELARRVNPAIEVLQLSVETGEGVQAWIDWIQARSAALLEDRLTGWQHEHEALRRRLEDMTRSRLASTIT